MKLNLSVASGNHWRVIFPKGQRELPSDIDKGHLWLMEPATWMQAE